jgi:hypothetical protein
MASVTRRLTLVVVTLMLVTALSAAQAQGLSRPLTLDDKMESQIERAVVYIEVDMPSSVESGSGFFVTPDVVLTNHHVVESFLTKQNARLTVRLFSGTTETKLFAGEVLAYDKDMDLALVRVKGAPTNITPLRIHTDLPPKQLQLFSFGFPLGTQLDSSKRGPNVSLRRGYVSRIIDDGQAIEADLRIDHGNSGGPVVDDQGLVRGVVEAIAGSDDNKSYACIIITGPTVISFCKAKGARVVLNNGQTLDTTTQLPQPVQQIGGETQAPRANVGQDVLRTFFSVGYELRISTLVPKMLVNQSSRYTADILKSSRSNQAVLQANLASLGAPRNLQQQAEELAKLLGQATVDPKLLATRADTLERGCDEWVKSVPREHKYNYDFGAWLTELSLGLIAVDQDLESCAYYLKGARDAHANPEILTVLERIQTNLGAMPKSGDSPEKQAIRKDADRLMAIGYLATTGGNNPLPKYRGQTPPATQPTPPPSSGNNRLHLPTF